MRFKIFFVAAACALAASPAVWAGTDDGSSSKSQTDARQAWQAKRDALAQQRLGGAPKASSYSSSTAQSMLDQPVRTEDASPVEADADRKRN